MNNDGGTAAIAVSHNLRLTSVNNVDNTTISTTVGTINFTPQSGVVKVNGVTVQTSDSTLKKDIVVLDSVLTKIENLNVYILIFKTDEYPTLNLPKSKQIGVIAQDVEKTFPELVYTDKSGFKSVVYNKLGAILIEAVKEKQNTIESQNNEIAELKTQIAAIKKFLKLN